MSLAGAIPDRSQLTESMVISAMSRYLDAPVAGVQRVAGSIANQDFFLRTPAEEFVLKAGDWAELAAEAWACKRVRDADVSSPEVVALELDEAILPAPFLLMRRLPGDGLTAGRHQALVEAGRQLRRLHSLRTNGYGCLSAGYRASKDTIDYTREPCGPYLEWSEFTAEAPQGLDELVAHQVITEKLALRVRTVLDDHRDSVRFEEPGVLLHGDMKPPHVFADNDQFVGLIDWGDVAVGDPLYDLARFSLVGEESMESLVTGYELDLDTDLKVTFAVYRIIRMITALLYELRADGDWFATYRACIESDLTLLT